MKFSLNPHAIELLQAAMPYTTPNVQGMVSFLVKYKELQETMQYIRHPPAMKACGVEVTQGGDTLLPLLNTLRSVCTPQEQQTVDNMIRLIQSVDMIGKYQTASKDNHASPFEAVKSMLTPEQKSMMEMYTSMFEQKNDKKAKK